MSSVFVWMLHCSDPCWSLSSTTIVVRSALLLDALRPLMALSVDEVCGEMLELHEIR